MPDINFKASFIYSNLHLIWLNPSSLTSLSLPPPPRFHRKLVERIDTDKDGQLDRSELFAWLSKVEDKVILEETASVFDKEDTDDDGYITIEEYMSNSGIPGKQELRRVALLIECC